MENYCYWPQDYGGQPADYGCYYPAAFSPPFDTAAEDEDRAATASRSHSEAEKRRRDRINAQFATLRKLIPKSEKMDKAALLGHVVDHVKEEKERARAATNTITMPTEIDEVVIDQLKEDESTSQNKASCNYMRASICCEDRPELFAELKSAIKGIGATIVEAEITSLGGRIKANFILSAKQQENCCSTLRMALSRLVVSYGSSSYSTRSKRQRFFYPTSH